MPNEDEYWDKTPKTNVWSAMSSESIIGPFFLDTNFNAQNYVDMLVRKFWPAIRNNGLCSKIIFQQDGAPAHYSVESRNWLDQKLPSHWIGRRSPIEWAAGSPDFTPLDFYLWGYVKQKVNVKKHYDLKELHSSISNVIKEIKTDVLKRVFSNNSKMLQFVIDHKRAHIEQYM